MFVLIRMII